MKTEPSSRATVKVWKRRKAEDCRVELMSRLEAHEQHLKVTHRTPRPVLILQLPLLAQASCQQVERGRGVVEGGSFPEVVQGSISGVNLRSWLPRAALEPVE